jgi:hypothetical protein
MNQPTIRQNPPDSAAYALRLAMFRVALAPPTCGSPITFLGEGNTIIRHCGSSTPATLRISGNTHATGVIRAPRGLSFKLTLPAGIDAEFANCDPAATVPQMLGLVPGSPDILGIGREQSCTGNVEPYVLFNGTNRSLAILKSGETEDADYALTVGKDNTTNNNSARFLGNVQIDGALRAPSGSPLLFSGSTTFSPLFPSDRLTVLTASTFSEAVTFTGRVRIEKAPFIVDNSEPTSLRTIVARIPRTPSVGHPTYSGLRVEQNSLIIGDVPTVLFDVDSEGTTFIGGKLSVYGQTDLYDRLRVDHFITLSMYNKFLLYLHVEIV